MNSLSTLTCWFIRSMIVALLVLSSYQQTLATPVVNTGSCNTNDPSAPCFANVSDILQGQRSLLPINDLVLTTSLNTSATSDAGPVTSFLLNTANSSISLPPIDPNKISTADEPSFVTKVGRVFDLPKDVIVTQTSNILNVSVQQPNRFDIGFGLGSGMHPVGMEMADFTGDGFDDIAVYFHIGPLNDSKGGLQIVTAKNVQKPPVLTEGPELNNIGVSGLNGSITAGDFNGDGQNEIAITYISSTGNIRLEIYTVNPESLAIKFAKSIEISATSVGPVKVLAGNFDATANAQIYLPDDEIVVVYQGIASVFYDVYGFL